MERQESADFTEPGAEFSPPLPSPVTERRRYDTTEGPPADKFTTGLGDIFDTVASFRHFVMSHPAAISGRVSLLTGGTRFEVTAFGAF